MGKRIRRSLILTAVFSVILAIVLSLLTFHKSFKLQIENDLEDNAKIIASSYKKTGDMNVFLDIGVQDLRISLINQNGTVIFDNVKDINQMENHLNRPEIMEAIEKGSAKNSRRSNTIGEDVFYHAIRLESGDILRVSSETDSLYKIFTSGLVPMVGAIFVLMVISLIESVYLTKKLMKPIINLANNMESISEPYVEIYKELLPLISVINNQSKKIKSQLYEIEAEKNKLSTILQNMSEGLLVLDMQKKVLISNESIKTFLKIEGNIENIEIFKLKQNKHLEDCVNIASQGKSVSNYVNFEGRTLQILANPVFIEHEQVGTICFILDVTEKNQIERMKQEFTANVSHELKTPLTSITGYAEMLKNNMVKNEEDVKNFSARIYNEATRLLTLISDIIKLSEIDEKKDDIEFEEIDLLEIADECADILLLNAKKNNINIIVEGESSVITANPGMISELVYNLCDNAIRYNKKGGEVRINVADSIICITDNGIGIPEDSQSRIFGRFYRVDKSRSKETGGTGLGLAIVKHIAEQHNAKIELESEEGIGTSVKVIFNKDKKV